MALPRSAKFSQAVTTTWSDGSNFHGFILIGLVPPTSGGTDWASIDTGADQYPRMRIPVLAFVPIVAGKFHAESTMWFTADLTPPNTRYVAWYFDSTKRQIAGPSAQFQVTTDPFTPPSATLTVPTVGTTNPTPDA